MKTPTPGAPTGEPEPDLSDLDRFHALCASDQLDDARFEQRSTPEHLRGHKVKYQPRGEVRRERRRKLRAFWRRYAATVGVLVALTLLGGNDGGVKCLVLLFPIALPPALLWFGVHRERIRSLGSRDASEEGRDPRP